MRYFDHQRGGRTGTTMETKLTPAQLAEDLEGVLERVRLQAERFVIERDGRAVATISPPVAPPVTTWAEVVARIGHLKMPGDGFADDLERIQAEHGDFTIRERPDQLRVS